MATTQQIVDLDLVQGVAAEIDEDISVDLDGDEIVLSKGRTEERYDTAEEAIGALRASWGQHGR